MECIKHYKEACSEVIQPPPKIVCDNCISFDKAEKKRIVEESLRYVCKEGVKEKCFVRVINHEVCTRCILTNMRDTIYARLSDIEQRLPKRKV